MLRESWHTQAKLKQELKDKNAAGKQEKKHNFIVQHKQRLVDNQRQEQKLRQLEEESKREQEAADLALQQLAAANLKGPNFFNNKAIDYHHLLRNFKEEMKKMCQFLLIQIWFVRCVESSIVSVKYRYLDFILIIYAMKDLMTNFLTEIRRIHMWKEIILRVKQLVKWLHTYSYHCKKWHAQITV